MSGNRGRIQAIRAQALGLLLMMAMTCPFAQAKRQEQLAIKPGEGPYLFAGFKDNAADGIYFAISDDGYHWSLLNNGQLAVKVDQKGELMRDPFIQRDPAGGFRMVWTWAWKMPVIGYSTSIDLIHWTTHQRLAVMKNEPSVINVWAPALYWDAQQERWLILWSSTIPGRFPHEQDAKNGYNHRIYSTTTKDFVTFAPAKIFFDPGYSVIDATILPTANPYYLVFKDECEQPLEKHILAAQGKTIEGPWTNVSQPFTDTWSEGPSGIKVGDTYVVYYDHYSHGQHYGAAASTDLVHWKDITSSISFPAGLRHGSFTQITKDEARLLRKWPNNEPSKAAAGPALSR